MEVCNENAKGDTKTVYELEEDFTAMFEDAMDSMMEGAIDLAEELTPDMDGVHIGEGFMYAIEGEERGQAGIDGQEIGEAEDTIIGQVGEVAEMMQQGEDRTGEEVRQDVARDTLDRRTGQEDKTQNSDEMARGQVAPNAMGIIGQLQNVAREEPNDYTQEDTYQTPTLDNLEEDKKGGILGFFSKIKEAIQARFAKKPEQKRLNPSSEQRTDENGWNITTYDGNGKDLVPKSTGIRNAMVRFAENTIGKVAKLTTNAPRSSEPINTPYVIPTNVQSREDKQQVVTKDKTNQWAVDPSRLSPLEHGKKDKDEQVQGDGER